MNTNVLRFCPRSRKRMVEMRNEGKKVKEIAKELNTSKQTVYTWLNRHDPLNEAESLTDKKTTPRRKPRKTPKILERIVITLRDRKGWSSLKIHLCLKKKNIINPSTGSHLSEYAIRAIFHRYERGYQFDKKKIKKLQIVRYEKQKAGELVHIDVKKLSNVKGENPKKKKYEIALIDDCTRIVYSEILPNKKAKTAALFFSRAVSWFKTKYNIEIQAVLSDNGKEFTWHDEEGRKFHPFELMCKRLNIKHQYTRIRRPQTNGKVERIHKTLQDELFTKIRFHSHEHRNKELQKYLYYYNNNRMHMGLNGLTPVEKLILANAA